MPAANNTRGKPPRTLGTMSKSGLICCETVQKSHTTSANANGSAADTSANATASEMGANDGNIAGAFAKCQGPCSCTL